MINFKDTFTSFLKDERGVSTLQFVIAFPLFFSVVAVTFDSGILMARYVILENALDRVVREVRLTGIASDEPGHTFIKQELCNIVTLVPDCENVLHVDMVPIPLNATMAAPGDANCVDRNDVDNPPSIKFTMVPPDEIAYIRACIIVDRAFPTLLGGAFKEDDSGGIVIIAKSAFVVEP
jgi:hypothetical protein